MKKQPLTPSPHHFAHQQLGLKPRLVDIGGG
jgi:hypothetical protein